VIFAIVLFTKLAMEMVLLKIVQEQTKIGIAGDANIFYKPHNHIQLQRSASSAMILKVS
jgi:hypothetical protein